MKRREALWASAAVLGTPAMAGLTPGLKAPVARVSADVIATLNRQATLWTAGDLDGFCAVYAEQALFLSPGGLSRGRAEVLARYRKKYVDGPDGKAGMDYVNGRFTADDDQVCINLSGGLKAKGHPVGATGASMHALVYKQLMEEPIGLAPTKKVPKIGVTFNVGGSGVTNAVTVLRRVK